MSYNPRQQQVDGPQSLEIEFAETWKQAVLGNRRAQQILMQRINPRSDSNIR